MQPSLKADTLDTKLSDMQIKNINLAPTSFMVLKSILVKTVPRNGRGQGPGGNLRDSYF